MTTMMQASLLEALQLECLGWPEKRLSPQDMEPKSSSTSNLFHPHAAL